MKYALSISAALLLAMSQTQPAQAQGGAGNMTGRSPAKQTAAPASRSASSAPTGTEGPFGLVEFRIRDSNTGYGIAATLTLYPTQGAGIDRAKPIFLPSDAHGRGRYELPAQDYLVEVSAPGYPPQKTHFVIQAGSTLPTTVMMPPERPPDELRKEVLEQKYRPGFTLRLGYVVDAVTLRPLPNVRLVMRESDADTGQTTTDAKGYFEFLVPVRAPADGPCSMADLIAEAPGYKTYVRRNILLNDGSGTISIIDMEPGEGRQEKDVRHKFCGGDNTSDHPSVHAAEPFESLPQGVDADEGVEADVRAWLTGREPGTLQSTAATTRISLPSMITVGTNCPTSCSACCSSTISYPLEEYVQRGLDEEWPLQWNVNALQAGAVAYRSYGAYYQALHGRSASNKRCRPAYDIRSDTCNQAFMDDIEPQTQAAAQATAGVVLTQDQRHVFQAEYSLENNEHKCTTQPTNSSGVSLGNCTNPDYTSLPAGTVGDFVCNADSGGRPYAGSVSAQWPCVSDNHTFTAGTGLPGQCCVGHGRGMCQFGSKEWANVGASSNTATGTYNWGCILDHYYNDNGNRTGAGTGKRAAFLTGAKMDSGLGGFGRITFTNYVFDGSHTNIEIFLQNVDGTGLQQITHGDVYDIYGRGFNGQPSWSPDGKRIVFATLNINGYTADIAVVNADGSGLTNLTSTSNLNASLPNWSPDGTRIVFSGRSASVDDILRIYTMKADGSELQVLASSPTDFYYNPAWSPDGTMIAFTSAALNAGTVDYHSIKTMKADGSNVITRASGAFEEILDTPSWSPDGTMIAYTSTPAEGQSRIDVVTLANGNAAQLTSGRRANDSWPRWSADGKRIMFISDRSSLLQLYTMEADGSNQTQVAGGAVASFGFDWAGCPAF